MSFLLTVYKKKKFRNLLLKIWNNLGTLISAFSNRTFYYSSFECKLL